MCSITRSFPSGFTTFGRIPKHSFIIIKISFRCEKHSSTIFGTDFVRISKLTPEGSCTRPKVAYPAITQLYVSALQGKKKKKLDAFNDRCLPVQMSASVGVLGRRGSQTQPICKQKQPVQIVSRKSSRKKESRMLH